MKEMPLKFQALVWSDNKEKFIQVFFYSSFTARTPWQSTILFDDRGLQQTLPIRDPLFAKHGLQTTITSSSIC